MYSKVVIIRWNLTQSPTLSLYLELIGEEIYDEFDPEGAYGDRYPYESPSGTVQDRDGGDSEAPHRMSSISNQRPQSTTGSTNPWNSQAKPLATALAGHIPTSLKSLGLLRTRSAPAVPGETETDKHAGDDMLTGTEWEMMDDEKESVHFFSETDPGHPSLGTAIQMPKPIKGTGRYLPSTILERHSTISSYESTSVLLPREIVPETVIIPEGRGWALPPSTHQNLPSLVVIAPALARITSSASLGVSPQVSAIQTAPPTPTGAPPAPFLEAILLERRRRLMATSSNVSNSSTPVQFGPHNNSPSPALSANLATLNEGSVAPLTLIAARGVHNSSGKGTMFKSSPLGGGDRVGAVVSERVKAAKKSEDVQSPGQEGEGSEVEKAGLGKGWNSGNIPLDR